MGGVRRHADSHRRVPEPVSPSGESGCQAPIPRFLGGTSSQHLGDRRYQGDERTCRLKSILGKSASPNATHLGPKHRLRGHSRGARLGHRVQRRSPEPDIHGRTSEHGRGAQAVSSLSNLRTSSISVPVRPAGTVISPDGDNWASDQFDNTSPSRSGGATAGSSRTRHLPLRRCTAVAPILCAATRTPCARDSVLNCDGAGP